MSSEGDTVLVSAAGSWRVFVACIVCIPATTYGQTCQGSQPVSVRSGAAPRSMVAQKIGNAVLFQAGMTIDIDGAPNAYGPNDTGLDLTQNAKVQRTGKWAAVLLDEHGKPIVQQSGPYRGYYISTTSLSAAGRYADATQIPYIVLSSAFATQFGVRLGDFAVVSNKANGKSAYAIYADTGPDIGEGSVALADTLGINSNARHGGIPSGISFLIFPKSGAGQGTLPTLDDINRSGAALFLTWGGIERMRSCVASESKHTVGGLAPSPERQQLLTAMQQASAAEQRCADHFRACYPGCISSDLSRADACKVSCGAPTCDALHAAAMTAISRFANFDAAQSQHELGQVQQQPR